MKILRALVVSTSLLSFTAAAEVPVEVASDTSSDVGKVMALVLKGKIAESSTLRLASSGEDRLQLLFKAMDKFGVKPGVGTAFSVVITWSGTQAPMPVFFDHLLGYCGADRVDDCSNELMKILEQHAAAIERARSNAAER